MDKRAGFGTRIPFIPAWRCGTNGVPGSSGGFHRGRVLPAFFAGSGDADDKDDVVAGFEGGDDGAVAGVVGDGALVDLLDDEALGEADFIGEGAGG